MIRVLIVDDHDVVSKGLSLLLDAFEDVTVVGTADSGATGVTAAAELHPDVVLMDLSMPGMDGVEATRRIVAADDSASVVILTTFADRDGILGSLDAGAVGYLMKDVTPEALHDGVVAAAAEGSPIDPRVARTLVEARRSGGSVGARLTAKQREVLQLVAEGLPNRQIARRLGITEKTVKAHLTHIYTALGVGDRVQAALWARSNLKDVPA